MHLNTLRLYNFRNLENKALSLHPKLNFFVGLNGQGKTNLVEAVTFLSLTKSFRSSKIQELIRWGETEGSVIAEIEDETGTFTLGAILSKGNRKLLLNDNPISASEFVGRIVVISFSPNDIEIIKGGPVERRRFLDKHTTDIFPGSFQYLLKYNAALQRKNAILKEEGVAFELVDPWNKVLSETGWKVFEARTKFIQRFNPLFSQVHQEFAAVDGKAECRYLSKLERMQSPQELYIHLKEQFEKERTLGHSTFGPHKDDLLITIGGIESRAYASQGQSKSLALSLRLAVINLFEEERKEQPVVVLDDVDSELDRERLSRLYGFIFDSNRQVFVTTTEKRIDRDDCIVFQVEKGAITHR